MKKLGDVLKSVAGVLLLAVLAVVLVSCKPKEIELPFETIERRETAGTGKIGQEKEPGLMIIATPEDLAQTDKLFTKNAQAQLNELDFDAYFAIAAFLGWQSGGHEGIDIERVIHRRDKVLVYARVGNPTPDTGVTSPYHLVTVQMEGNWNRKIRFTLHLDGTAATSLTHFIP